MDLKELNKVLKEKGFNETQIKYITDLVIRRILMELNLDREIIIK